MSRILESDVEEACLDWFRAIGYRTAHGPDIGPGGIGQERDAWSEGLLIGRLRSAIARINPTLPADAVDSVIATVRRAESQNALAENARVHRLITEGVPVEHRVADGSIRHALAWLVDFAHPLDNDWLVVNQLTVVEDSHTRRPDVVVYLNGLPVGLIELKNAADEHATVTGAWNQLQTYRREIGSLLVYNAVCVASDGLAAVMGAVSGRLEQYAPWKTIDEPLLVSGKPGLEVLVRGVFEPGRFCDLLRSFIVFSDEPAGLVKRVARYHQFWAVRAAVERTIEASSPDGDRRGGVVWHTQGSGKSFEMLCYAAKVMRDPAMGNPTLVLITDRNDLDDQLFAEVFAPARILPEAPVQAASRTDMRRLLARASGGIVFTTLQKFAPEERGDLHPVLTDRRNVVVIADEAHRSQYDFLDGYARHLRDALPNATYLGFTGTPIEAADRSTRQVFGDYIDVYDLTRAVEDGATVRIYYESRIARVDLPDDVARDLDETIDELAEREQPTALAKARTRWAQVEAVVGADARLDAVAADIVAHWERRRADEPGKAMIVGMSRRISVALYERIVRLRPDWHDPDHRKGRVKVVMTGSAADPPAFQSHLLSREAMRRVKARARDPDDALELVIVRDMWLTGFDAPPVHTMYVDKPMRGAGLMQAIARVNRTFRGKAGGLVVDYIGIAASLRDALADYSPTDQQQAGVPIEQVVALLREKHDIVVGILHGHPWSADPYAPASVRLGQVQGAMDFLLADEDRTARFLDQVLALSRAFALAGTRDEAMALRDDVRFFADVRSSLLKLEAQGEGGRGTGSAALDAAIGQLVSEAIASQGVIDVYATVGMERPEISILGDEFLDGLGLAGKPNLQLALLRRLLDDRIRTMRRENVVESRRFSEMLEEAIRRYQNRALTTAEIIMELVTLAKSLRESEQRGVALGLRPDEVAFYDAIRQNEAAVLELGDETLKAIAQQLVTAVRESATIDWDVKETVRAAMRAKVRRLLNRCGYPPDGQEQAVRLVIEQAELLAKAA